MKTSVRNDKSVKKNLKAYFTLFKLNKKAADFERNDNHSCFTHFWSTNRLSGPILKSKSAMLKLGRKPNFSLKT